MDSKKIGARLKTLRGTKPREEVTHACGISVLALSMYENGERNPRDPVKVKLANYYNFDVQAIFLLKKYTICEREKE